MIRYGCALEEQAWREAPKKDGFGIGTLQTSLQTCKVGDPFEGETKTDKGFCRTIPHHRMRRPIVTWAGCWG